jgi:hypothetical protein
MTTILPLDSPTLVDLHWPAGTRFRIVDGALHVTPAPARWSPTMRLLAAMHTEHARRADTALPPADAPAVRPGL